MGSFTKLIIASMCVIFLAVKWTAPRFDEGRTEIQPSACRLLKNARTLKTVHMTYVQLSINTQAIKITHTLNICKMHKIH